MTKVLPRIWCKVYSNGPHFSATPKDGYTCYVPQVAPWPDEIWHNCNPDGTCSDKILPQTRKMLEEISRSVSRGKKPKRRKKK